MNLQLIIAGGSLVITVGLLIVVYLQVRAARMERLESLWDFIYQGASKEAEEMEEKEKIKDLTNKDKRIKLRRNRHLFLERIEEALRIEKAKKWDLWDYKELKKRHTRVQKYYWSHLKVYGDDDRAFEDLKIWHDYSSGDLDPLEVGLRILNFLADEKEEEAKIVNKVFTDLTIPEKENIKKEAERKLKNRLQDLKEFGFINYKKKLTCKKYWELSEEGKEVIQRKSK